MRSATPIRGAMAWRGVDRIITRMVPMRRGRVGWTACARMLPRHAARPSPTGVSAGGGRMRLHVGPGGWTRTIFGATDRFTDDIDEAFRTDADRPRWSFCLRWSARSPGVQDRRGAVRNGHRAVKAETKDHRLQRS